MERYMQWKKRKEAPQKAGEYIVKKFHRHEIDFYDIQFKQFESEKFGDIILGWCEFKPCPNFNKDI